MSWQDNESKVIEHTCGDTFYHGLNSRDPNIDLAAFEIRSAFIDAAGKSHPFVCGYVNKTVITLFADKPDTETWAIGRGVFNAELTRKSDGFRSSTGKFFIKVIEDETV